MSVSSLTFKTLYFLISIIVLCTASNNGFCERPGDSKEECGTQQRYSKKRYIFYDVNRAEGFNIRRDVYIRAAVFVKTLAEEDKEFQWHLVLPPWDHLYHWKSNMLQARLPWHTFFDVTSLQKYAPVIELYQFFDEHKFEGKEIQLDCVYILQNDEEMFKTGKFVDKNEVVNCNWDSVPYRKLEEQKYEGRFWRYSNVTSKDVKCVVFHGMTSDLKQNLQPTLYKSVMFDRMEVALHDYYGSRNYWQARRSMRYTAELYSIANGFRKTYLNSTDQNDNAYRPTDWTKEKSRRNAIGGPYLSVHLRRGDFLVSRAKQVPTIKSVASQLRKKLKKLELHTVFVATDAEQYEFDELKTRLSEYSVLKYVPSDYVKEKFKDGGIAIIEQIICSYARYFIGTHESTFSFRIQEDREIIGFPTNTTFNRLCKTGDKCSPGSQWEIVW